MTEAPDDPPLSIQLPPSGTGARARHRQQRKKERRTQQAWFTSAVVILAAAIPLLAYIGFHSIITTTEGRRVDPQNDPEKTNFEVDVVPTPTALIVQTDVDNKLTGLTMVSLGAGDVGGAAVFIPPTTVTEDVIPDPDSSTTTTTTTKSSTTKPEDVELITLAAAFEEYGFEALGQLTSNVVGLSFGEVVLVSDELMGQFVTPVAPLTIQNPDRLVSEDEDGKATVRFPAGELALEAADVPAYLGLRNPNETDVARLTRQQAVWEAWLDAVRSSSDPNVIPGETAQGLGRYVRGLAAGDAQFSVLPVTADENDEGDEIFTPDPTAIESLMASYVPLPTPANPGDRVRVRLLSGVGPLDVPAMLATHLVPANAQITIVGNADRFDYAESQIIYYDDVFADAATELQTLLGLGAVTKRGTATDTEDLTLIIGQDLVDRQNLAITKDDSSSG